MSQATDPTFGAIYSAPGKGKTLALIRAFPDALFVSPRGGLKCGSWLDWKPKELRANGIRNIPKVIEKFGRQFPAIIFCDLSLEADSEARRLRTELTGWDVWNKYGEHFLVARDAARDAGCHVWWEFHESPPKLDSGEVVRQGTFSLSGYQAAEKIPGMLDVVAHVEWSSEHLGAGIWPYVLSKSPSRHWVTKDRYSVFPRQFPLNIREPLMARGHELPRPKSIAWVDKVADTVATKMVAAAGDDRDIESVPVQEIVAEIVAKVPGKNPRHVRWGILDGIDRAWLRLKEESILTDFVAGLGEVENEDGSV